MSLTNPNRVGRRPQASRASVAALAFSFVLGGPWAATASPWHPDLPAAVEASRTSGKPVLVILDARWNEADRPNPEELYSHPDVAAVVAASFEPLRVDVEAEPGLTRDLGVQHVPMACVLDGEGRVLSRFECAPGVSEFIAAVTHAAQQASQAATRESHAVAPAATAKASQGSASATASALANKVRNLAGFAESSSPTSEPSSRFRPAAISGGHFTADTDDGMPTPVNYLEEQPQAAPAYPGSTPPQQAAVPRWPAEPATGSAFTAFNPAQPAASSGWPAAAQPPAAPPAGGSVPAPGSPSIEPAGSVNPNWLTGQAAAAPTTPIPQPAPAESAAALPATSGEPAAAPTPPTTMERMTAFFKQPWSVFSRPAAKTPPPPPTLPPARSLTSAAVVASAAPQSPDPHGTMPLGLEGYCPVTLVERGAWVEGRAQWGVRHRGRTYLFAGPEQQQAFLASPDRYAPALSGDDPVLALESGRSEPGRRAYGVTYQSRMYLFATPETRAAFSADPGRYTARVMIAEGLVPTDDARRRF